MHHMDGNRPLPADRDTLGRLVREAWVRWAKTQPDPKPSWLVPYDELSEPDKEADRQIGETIARWTLVIGGLWVVGSALDGYTRLSSEKAACQRRAEKPYDYHRC